MNRRLLSRLLFACALVTALVTAAGSAAQAAPVLLTKSVPTIDATVAVAPTELHMFFSQRLSAAPTIVMTQTTPVGGTIPLDPPVMGATAAEWTYHITLPLAPGVYSELISGSVETTNRLTITGAAALTPGAVPTTTTTVARTTIAKGAAKTTLPLTTVTVTAPGQAVTGSSVAGASTVTKTDAVRTVADAGSAGADFLGAVGRWLTYLGLSALFGGLLLIAMAWPEGVEFILTVRFFRLAWVGALVGTIFTIISLTATLKGVSIGSAVSPGSWFDIKSNGEGLAALARLLFVGGSAWVAFGPERAVNPASQLPAFAFPFLSLVTFGFSRASEAKMVPVGVVAGGLHVVAMAAWLGGLLLLARVALTGPGDADLMRAVRGFSRIAVPALLIVVATGAVQVFRLVGGPAKLFSTGYGRLLLLKVFVVALMAYVATANRHFVRLRLGRATVLNDRAAFRLRRSIAGESTVGLVVLAFSALMMNVAPAGLSASAATANGGAAASEVVTFKQTGIDATVGIGPAIAGQKNTIRITVRTASVIDIAFSFYPVNGVGVPFSITPPAAQLTGGKTFLNDSATFVAVVDPNVGSITPAPGIWKVIVSGHTQTSDIPEVTKTFTVAAATAASSGSTSTTVPTGSGTTPATAPGTTPAG